MRDTRENKSRILVASDDAVSREILLQLLRMAGYEPLAAETGERALMILREEGRHLDGLVADVQLPRLVDGWILAEEFRHLHPGKGIVLASSAEADLGRRENGTVFIRKPMSPPEVLMTVQDLYSRPDGRSSDARETPEVEIAVGRDEPYENDPHEKVA